MVNSGYLHLLSSFFKIFLQIIQNRASKLPLLYAVHSEILLLIFSTALQDTPDPDPFQQTGPPPTFSAWIGL